MIICLACLCNIEADILSQKTISDYNFVLVAVHTFIRATTFTIWVNLPLILLFRCEKRKMKKGRQRKTDHYLKVLR